MQFSGYYLFDDFVSFRSQYDYCVHVLESVPSTIGIIVNMHPEYPALDEEAIKFLTSKYKNFIYIEEFNTIYASGQFILPFVDGVITISSSIGLQTLLFDKKLIDLSQQCFSYMSDSSSLDNIEKILKESSKNKNAILYYLLTRYSITSAYIHNPQWLNAFLKHSLAYFREKKTINFDFFDIMNKELNIFKNLNDFLSNNFSLIPQYLDNTPLFQVFFDFGDGISKTHFLTTSFNLEQKEREFVFDNISQDHVPIQSLRIDPLNRNCIIELVSIVLVKNNLQEIQIHNDIYSNACQQDKNLYLFDTNDSQIFLIPQDKSIFYEVKQFKVTLKYLFWDTEASKYIQNYQYNIISSKEQEIDSLQNIVSSKEQEIIHKSMVLSESNKLLQHFQHEYTTILQSKSWKITAPLRKIFSYMNKASMRIKSLLAFKAYITRSIFNSTVRNKIHRFQSFSASFIKPIAPKLHYFIFETIKRLIKKKLYNTLRFDEAHFIEIETKKDDIDQSYLFTSHDKKEFKVSVIVPNYNHEKFLRSRLDSIYQQSYQNFEVILLDDMSSDQSVMILEEYAQKYKDKTTLIINNVNSGGVFHQWKRGIESASGELIWIAESDDFCSLDFLEKLIPFFNNTAIMLAYSKTIFIQDDQEIWTINDYLNDIDPTLWNHSFIASAHRLVNYAWGIKNILPNASSALFRNPKGMSILDNSIWQSMRICGDWVFYLHMIRGGLVGYTPETINYYRIHTSNTSVATYSKDIYYKEHAQVAKTLCELYSISESLLRKQHDTLKQHWDSYMSHKNDNDFIKNYNLETIVSSQKNRKPNIMMVTYALAAGGGETLPIKMANMLHDLGYSVTVMSFEQDVENIGVTSMLKSYIPLFKLKHLEKTNFIVTSLGIEITHSHHAWVDLTLIDLLNENKTTKMVISTHGMYEMMDSLEFEENFSLIKKRVSKIVYTADKNALPFINMGCEANFLTKIGNALEFSKINPIMRTSLGINQNSFVLCLVSRAIPQKGWEEAIKSIKLARELSTKDIHLILIGEGEEYTRLKPNTTDNFVHFLGFQSNIRDYFAMADVGFLPSRFEGESFPLVILDCLYAHKPVLASNIGEIYDMLTENNQVAGAIFELENMKIPINKVATLIVKLAEDHVYYDTCLNNVSSILKKHDPKKMILKYDQVYQDILRTTRL